MGKIKSNYKRNEYLNSNLSAQIDYIYYIHSFVIRCLKLNLCMRLCLYCVDVYEWILLLTLANFITFYFPLFVLLLVLYYKSRENFSMKPKSIFYSFSQARSDQQTEKNIIFPFRQNCKCVNGKVWMHWIELHFQIEKIKLENLNFWQFYNLYREMKLVNNSYFSFCNHSICPRKI